MCKRRIHIVILAVVIAALFGCMSVSRHALIRAKQSYAEQNYGDMFQTLWHAVPYGDPAVEYALGYCYYTGMGIRSNYVMARYYFYQAAKQLYPPAVKALALLTPQDPAFVGWQHNAMSAPVRHRSAISPVPVKRRSASTALPIPGHRAVKQSREPTHIKNTRRAQVPSAARPRSTRAAIPVPRPALPVPSL